MKVLTIKEPYASLIANNYKKYEFRTWKTNYRGPIYIHTSKVPNKNISKFKKYNLNYKNGYIIAKVNIVDCIMVDEKMDKYLKKLDSVVYEDNYIGCYAWKIEDVEMLKNPIPISGKLGLWNYEEKEKKNEKNK